MVLQVCAVQDCLRCVALYQLGMVLQKVVAVLRQLFACFKDLTLGIVQGGGQHGCQRLCIWVASFGFLGELDSEVDDLELRQVQFGSLLWRLACFDLEHPVFESIFLFWTSFLRKCPGLIIGDLLGWRFSLSILEGGTDLESASESLTSGLLITIVYDYWAAVFILLFHYFL